VTTDSGNRIDVLGIDEEGDLHIIEIKCDRTPREVVAQGLEYTSWVRTLGYDDVTGILEDGDAQFESSFDERFGVNPPEELNRNHNVTIVASELDSSTEQIVEYLSEEHAVPINALLFNYYADGDREYIGRTWLADPDRPRGETNGGTEPWNGRDFYVNFGDSSETRAWADGREYGFVAAGQGRTYSQPLEKLQPGNRVFAYVPGSRYVGVGIVTSEAVRVTDFQVEHEGRQQPVLGASLQAEHMDANKNDPEMCEYLVGVDWIDTREADNAVRETGMFAVPNIVCKLRNQFTVERLLNAFDVDEQRYSCKEVLPVTIRGVSRCEPSRQSL